MKLKSSKTNITILIIFIIILTLFSSCSRKKTDETNENNNSIKVTEQEDSVKKIVKTPETKEESIEESLILATKVEADPKDAIKLFDAGEYGYHIKENKLFLNDEALPAENIQSVKEGENSTTYTFMDGSTLLVKSNGDLVAKFPIGITLQIDKDFKKYETLYNNDLITTASIYNLLRDDNGYTIDYPFNTLVKFNNSDILFKIADLKINYSRNISTTYLNDNLITSSEIEYFDLLDNVIRIRYKDGNRLIHKIDGNTEYIFKSGNSIESADDTIIIKNEDQTKIVFGAIDKINFDEDAIVLTAADENLKVDTQGNLISKELVAAEQKQDDPILPTQSEVTFEIEEQLESESLVEADTAVLEESIEETFEEDQEIIEIEDDMDFESEDNQTDATDAFGDREIIGQWDAIEETKPFRVGVSANFTLLQLNQFPLNSSFGLRGDFLVENEVKDGIVVGLQVGAGADKFSKAGTYNEFYKHLVASLTFSQEFTPSHSNVTYFYKVGIGSLIPIKEQILDIDETPYFRLGLSGGVNYNVDPQWMIRLSAEFGLNFRNYKLAGTSESVSLGLLYKF